MIKQWQTVAEGGHRLNLSCSICLHVFKTPKVLPCGHTFCCGCLSRVQLNRFNSSLKCPTCRRDIHLPKTGKVEDFPTNFALLNCIPNQARKKVESVCECPKHKTPNKFYCNSCKLQVCAECLLQDHKPDKHHIVTGSDTAAIFSGQLQNLIEKLQLHEQKKKSLDEKISTGLQCYKKDKKRIQDDIKNAFERKKIMLQKNAESLCYELNKKAEEAAGTYTDLQAQHTNLCNMSNKIHKKCDDLKQHLKQLHLSHASELEVISKSIESLKSATESLETTCQSPPTKVGLNFEPDEASTLELGKLSTISSTPMVLPNKACSRSGLIAPQKDDNSQINDHEDRSLPCKDSYNGFLFAQDYAMHHVEDDYMSVDYNSLQHG